MLIGILIQGYVGGLQTLRSLLDSEFYLLAFAQSAKSFSLDGTEVHKHIRAAIGTRNEAVALARAKPFDRTSYTFTHFFLCSLQETKFYGVLVVLHSCGGWPFPRGSYQLTKYRSKRHSSPDRFQRTLENSRAALRKAVYQAS